MVEAFVTKSSVGFCVDIEHGVGEEKVLDQVN